MCYPYKDHAEQDSNRTVIVPKCKSPVESLSKERIICGNEAILAPTAPIIDKIILSIYYFIYYIYLNPFRYLPYGDLSTTSSYYPLTLCSLLSFVLTPMNSSIPEFSHL